MLRMAHRIATASAAQLIRGIATTDSRYLLHYAETVLDLARISESVLVDNVVAYMLANRQKLPAVEEHVCLLLPWTPVMFEWQFTDPDTQQPRMAAILCHAVTREQVERMRASMREDLTQPGAETWERMHSAISVHMFDTDLKTPPSWNGCMAIVILDAAGRPLYHTIAYKRDASAETEKIVQARLHVPLVALDFLHMKNVVIREATAAVGPDAKWIRRQKAPEIRYHLLTIEAPGTVRKGPAAPIKDAAEALVASHVCRGYVATYTPEKPLFGRQGLHGRFWIPAHIRGSTKAGKVIKDYAVTPGAPDEPAPEQPHEDDHGRNPVPDTPAPD